jgi:hypothetical protein
MTWWDDLWTNILKVDPNVWQICVAVGTFLAVLASVTFGIIEGFKARRDRRELVELRKAANAKELISVASLVSAWIVDEYVPDPTVHSYRRTVTLHVANESSEPVFNSTVSVYLGDEARLIGPLGTPSPIPVIPPRRELTWDITTGVQAFSNNTDARAELGFSDASSRRWLRGIDGALKETTGKSVIHYREENPELADAQLGDFDSYRNPMFVARAFAEFLWSDPNDFDLNVFRALLDEEAVGWTGDWDEARVQVLRDQLAIYGNMATLAWYSSPKVAYARIFTDSALNQATDAGTGLVLQAQIITLTHHDGIGWRVFGVGPQKYRPDEIKFPDGEFT